MTQISQTDSGIYRSAAEELARDAGARLKSMFGQVSGREKGPFDLVTDADLASQRLIAEGLRQRFPEHTLLAEEEGVRPDPDRAFRWIVDPLDGTVNFAHGLPIWCVSIGLEHQGELIAGAIHQPLLDQTFSASRGGGATLNGEPMRVSTQKTLSTSLIAAGMPTGFEQDASRQLRLFGKFSTRTHSVRRTGSTAWNLAMVALGGFEVCFGTAINPWDAAAGVLLVLEAGGTVSRLDGQPYDLYGETLLATNGHVHAESIRAAGDALNDRADPR